MKRLGDRIMNFVLLRLISIFGVAISFWEDGTGEIQCACFPRYRFCTKNEIKRLERLYRETRIYFSHRTDLKKPSTSLIYKSDIYFLNKHI